MDLMVSFSMKYFNWTSSCFSFLAAGLGVGRHDIQRLNSLFQLFRWVHLIVLYRACRPLNQKSHPTTPPLYTWWLDPTPSRPNGVTTTGGRPPRPHLKPIPPSHLTFLLQLHRISRSLLDWNCFNGHLITFWMFIVPLLQHLLHLLIPVRLSRISLQSNVWRCPSRIEASVSGVLISSSSHSISPVVRGLSPPFANQQQQHEESV